MNTKELLELLKTHPNTKPAWVKAVDSGDYPATSLHMQAVNQDWYTIKYIENPSEEVQLAAMNQNGYAIRHIKNPSEEVQLAAVNQNGYAIEYIKNPSKEVQLAALKSRSKTRHPQ